jgi:hypothetical protein
MPPGPEDDVSQAEKPRIIREQASTLHQHAQAQANDTGGGRFASLGAPHVVGSTAIPRYPQAGPAFQVDPVGDEPPLSAYENPAIENPTGGSSVLASVEPGGAAAAPSSSLLSDVEPAAPPLSKGQDNG